MTRRVPLPPKASSRGACVECSKAEEIGGIHEGLMKLSAKIENGLSSRVRLIERMQWWQLGIMVAIVGAVIGGLWLLYQAAATDQAKLLEMLEKRAILGGLKP